MRMRKPFLLAGALAAALSAGEPGTSTALDVVAPPASSRGGEAFASVREAMRSGVRDYNAGDKQGAVRALEYAANQGHALALWKLGRMYADGDGVLRDDAKAFEYFSRIADENGDEPSNSARAGIVASALVALGAYYVDGIKGKAGIDGSGVEADPGRAVELLNYAASYFGDSNAQYNLGRLYLDGTGVDQDRRQAARWFNLAAEKGHHPAQAVLGQLLIAGEGVPRQPARGLMWLTLAKNAADPARDRWIATLHAEAYAEASDADRRLALAQLEQFQARRR